MTDTAITAATTAIRDAGWIPCRRCQGSGVASFKRKNGEDGTGPCYLCNGTGDGRIRNYNGFGPRKGGKRWNGHGNGQHGAVPVPAEDESDDSDESESAAPVVTAGHLTAAEHLAAALAGLTQSAPVDADMVRQILADEMGDARAKLERMIDQAVASRALLAEAIAGMPRKLTIVTPIHIGELPAMRHPLVEELIQYVGQNIPVYLVGPAGSGKTTACKQVAAALGLKYYYQGAMSGSHAVLGHEGMHRYHSTPSREAWEHGGLLLIDEIDGSEPDATMSIHPMDNGYMVFPDSPVPVARHPDFRLVAAANTWGNGADRLYVGTNQLNAATLDRFAFIDWGYDEALERQLAVNDDWCSFVQSVRKAVSHCKIRHVVSPRASIMGAKMLASGMPRDRVEAAFIWKGMTDQEKARVRESL